MKNWTKLILAIFCIQLIAATRIKRKEDSAPQPVPTFKRTKSNKTEHSDAAYSKGNQLTLVQAEYRKELLSNVAYDFTLTLPKGSTYFGKATIQFDLSRVPSSYDQPLFLDYLGTKISKLVVNEQDVQPNFDNGMIFLQKGLRPGKNIVSFIFLNNYRNDGAGMHSFIDNVDGHQYLYTKFEPAFCHYVFPTFDQPDLKAGIALKTIVPGDWVVVANEHPKNSQMNEALISEMEHVASELG